MSLDDQKAKSGRFLEATGAASALPDTRENGKIRLEFKATDFVVYPAHGVGQILSIEEQTVAGASLEFFVIFFKKSRMTVRVPVRKAANVGMRKPSDLSSVEGVKQILSETRRKGRGNWSGLLRNMKAKSTPEISSQSRRSLAIFSDRAIPARVSANGSCTCRRSIASAEKSRLWTESPRNRPLKSSRAC